jgi:flagellar L-ring protein precursor FlgH
MIARGSLVAALFLGGCAAKLEDIGRAPQMTAIGSGLSSDVRIPERFQTRPERTGPVHSLWEDSAGDLFRDARASRLGDLITVNISINDKASFGNSSERSRDSSITNKLDASGSFPTLGGAVNGTANADGGTSTKGDGKINRSEQIQLSVAAVVSAILPNGNLVISGSQEVRVNFELRELRVSGIVRPRDVSRDNTVSYDKIAEARISYGGRGRLTEVQQPALVHQVFDLIRPF